MNLSNVPTILSRGRELETGPIGFGELHSSSDLVSDVEGLRARMAADGYLFLPGFFDRDEVVRVRQSFCEALSEEGSLEPNSPVFEAHARAGLDMAFRADLANSSQPLKNLIYGAKIMSFYDDLFGGAARHYDYTWMRAVAPGQGSQPHCDIVFMGRGTPNVLTAWVPLGDIPLTTGGLIVLENSHTNEELRRGYCSMDIDAVCENREGARQVNAAGYPGYGALSDDPRGLREDFGARWLTAEYQMGDLLTFSMFTVHGSLDNQSDTIRLSTDSRYQLASEPIDERWIGEHPPGHGGDMTRTLIC